MVSAHVRARLTSRTSGLFSAVRLPDNKICHLTIDATCSLSSTDQLRASSKGQTILIIILPFEIRQIHCSQQFCL